MTVVLTHLFKLLSFFHFFLWPIWLFIVADMVFRVADMVVADMVCGRYGTDLNFAVKGTLRCRLTYIFYRSIKSLIYNIFTYKVWTLNFYRNGSEV